MRLTQRYNSLSSEGQNFVLLIIIGLAGTLACVPLALLPSVGLGGPLGFLLGSALELFSYWTICRGSKVLLSDDKSKPGSIALVAVSYLLRLALIAGAMVLACFCTFRWDAHFLYIWTLFAALLPVYPLLILKTLLKGKKKQKEGSDESGSIGQ